MIQFFIKNKDFEYNKERYEVLKNFVTEFIKKHHKTMVKGREITVEK